MAIDKFLKFSIINEFNLFDRFKKKPKPIYTYRRKYTHNSCFAGSRITLFKDEFKKLNMTRYLKEIPEGTYGYIVENIEYGYSTYSLFESLSGNQTILDDGDCIITQVSDDAVNKIVSDNNKDQNLIDISKIEEIFIELIDRGSDITIEKRSDGWYITIELHETKDTSWKTFKSMKKDLNIISDCLDRIVSIYGFDPQTEIKYPWMQIILKNPFS